MRHGDESIKGHIAHERQQQRIEQARERYCQRFLESLYYPEIDRRQDTVIEAHQKTFQWVYDPDSFDRSFRRWDSIAKWLESGDGIYWINGKAGSGKSTLMNYLSHNEQTLGLLRIWSGTKKVLMPKYFFWSAGTLLEKSVEGLLRSLLYQIFREMPSLIPLSCEHRSTFVSAKDRLDDFRPIASWTVRRLRTTFQTAIRQAETSYRICIFIDGLDENSGDPDAAIEEIRNMPSCGIKVCLSSRPERLYNDAFGSYAKLKLQDLTESDIRAYVADKLEPWLRTEPEDEVLKLMKDVAHKAQGVFLWVDLVVKALMKGLKNDDSLEQLQERVVSTPSDIEAVYANMLSKIDEAHYKEAAQLFQMALVGLTESLLDVALGLHDHPHRVSETSVSDVLEVCRRAQNRIPTICGGLLDIDLEDRDSQDGGGHMSHDQSYLCLPIRYTCSSDTADLSFFERYVHVSFIHRTAAEFLSQHKQGQSFLDKYPRLHPSPYANIVRSRLAKVKVLGLPDKPSNMDVIPKEAIWTIVGSLPTENLPVEERWDYVCEKLVCKFIHGLMELLCLDEWLVGSASRSLCHDLDHTLTAVYRRTKVERARFAHWSMHWGLRDSAIPDVTDGSPCFKGASQSQSSDAHSATSSLYSKSRPVDFLGHAASWSLSCYVIEEADQQKKLMDKDYATHLLCCTISAFKLFIFQWNRNESLPKSLDLIANLLSRGANPNTYIEDFSTTIWGYFISSAPWNDRSVREKLGMTTKIFVESGADIHMTLRGKRIFSWKSAESQVPSCGEILDVVLSREISIVHYLHAQPDFVETMVAKGARNYTRYNRISVEPQTNGLSKKQHDKWLAALNASHVDDTKGTEKVKRRWRFANQFREYYKNNPGEDEDSDIHINWEGGDDPNIDYESPLMLEVVDPPAKADLECQPIDG